MTDTKGTKLIDISEDMTDQFYKEAKKGQVLVFKNETETTYLKIVRLNRSKKICLCEETNLMTEEELNKLLSERKDG